MPRYKHTAVARNRLKRRLRELARLRLLPALADLPPADVVVRVWPSAYGAGFDALAADVERAMRQIVRAAERPGDGGEGRGERGRESSPPPSPLPVPPTDRGPAEGA